MQAVIDRLRKTPGPVLSVMLFGFAFVLGLFVFAVSRSVAVTALTMAMTSLASALAGRELISRPGDEKTKALIRDETRSYGKRLSDISDRIIEIEAELRSALSERNSPERMRLDSMARDIDAISTILGNLVAIIQTQDEHRTPKAAPPAEAELRKSIAPRRDAMIASSAERAPVQAKPMTKPANALAALQMENILREDILNGKLKIHLQDAVRLDTGRVYVRTVTCALEGRLAEFRNDADLVAGHISPGILQLYDRMRFGFAYEFASQFGTQTGLAPILCPLMDQTFASASAADEIVDMIEARQDLAQNFIIALSHTVLSEPTQEERGRLQRLNDADVALAVMLGNDLNIDPDLLRRRGVRYAVADAARLTGQDGQATRSAIHPADLASYLSRHDILLIATSADSDAMIKSLKSMGVMSASGRAASQFKLAATPEQRAQPADISKSLQFINPNTPDTMRSSLAPEQNVAPLREHLRRVRT